MTVGSRKRLWKRGGKGTSPNQHLLLYRQATQLQGVEKNLENSSKLRAQGQRKKEIAISGLRDGRKGRARKKKTALGRRPVGFLQVEKSVDKNAR